MNNLHPEQRPDKNGNLVTRWVRSFRRQSVSASLPAPSLHSPTKSRPANNRAAEAPSEITPEEREAKEREMFTTLFPAGIETHYNKGDKLANMYESRYDNMYESNERVKKNISFLMKHDADLLQRVLDSATSSKKEMEFWSNKVLRSKLHPSPIHKYDRDYEPVTDRTRDWFLSDYRTALATISFMKKVDFFEMDEAPISIQNFNSVVRAVLSPHMEEDKTDSEQIIEGIAAFSYLKGFHKEFMFGTSNMSNTIYDDNEEYILYLSDRVDKVPGIVNEVQRREVTDLETIKLLIESPTTALADGEL